MAKEDEMEKVLLANGKTFELVPDECAENPRKAWDNLCTVAGSHRRYDIFDAQAESSGDICRIVLRDLIGTDSYAEANRLYTRAEEQENEDLYVKFLDKYTFYLPVFMYEHSGATISTTPFSCPWDSGQIGVIFITKEKFKKEFGVKILSSKQKRRAEFYLKCEIDTLDSYVRGSVYGAVLKDKDEETIESCWGFYGDNILLSGVFDYARDILSRRDLRRVRSEITRRERMEYRSHLYQCKYFSK